MSLQLAAKLGAAGTLVAGVPTTYFVWDKYFSLNEIENAVLENTSATWSVTTEGEGTTVKAKASANVTKSGESTTKNYVWECEITASMPGTKNKDDFKKYLESKLNSSLKKEENRRYLVKYCSKDRLPIETDTPTTQKTRLSITVELQEEKLSTYLLGAAES